MISLLNCICMLHTIVSFKPLSPSFSYFIPIYFFNTFPFNLPSNPSNPSLPLISPNLQTVSSAKSNICHFEYIYERIAEAVEAGEGVWQGQQRYQEPWLDGERDCPGTFQLMQNYQMKEGDYKILITVYEANDLIPRPADFLLFTADKSACDAFVEIEIRG